VPVQNVAVRCTWASNLLAPPSALEQEDTKAYWNNVSQGPRASSRDVYQQLGPSSSSTCSITAPDTWTHKPHSLLWYPSPCWTVRALATDASMAMEKIKSCPH